MTKITLIIPDIHLKWERAEKIIAAVGADEIIFLGDYFDDFDDNPEMVRETCSWLAGSVTKPNRIHLFGNHDQHYAYPYRSFQCSGYAQWKYFIVHDNIDPKVWDKLKWFHFLDDRWLLSHAGLHKLNVPDKIKKFHEDRPKFIAELTGWLGNEIRQGFQDGANSKGSWVFNAGVARGGHQRVGGITWCDFEQEFYPLRGINQIVGHTPQEQGVRWCILDHDPINTNEQVVFRPYDLFKPHLESLDNPDLSHNICLDVYGNMHYATWDGKELKIGNYKDL